VSVATDDAQGNSSSGDYLSLSGDGRFIAFASYATNLVAGDANAHEDVFVRDRQASGPPSVLLVHAQLGGGSSGTVVTWRYSRAYG
jgi:hypothetical protein